MSFPWNDTAVKKALSIAAESGTDERTYTGVSTDTRTLESGNLFVALRGESYDAHDFLLAAVDAGATGLVVEREAPVPEGPEVYRVDDTLVGLGALARYRRQTLKAPVVGITGSSGKTSTKDLLRGALSSSLQVHATKGNLNNRIGLPLTLLAAPDHAEAVVLEMGTNEPGEIGALTQVAQPDIGVITTVSETHLEKLGSLDGVLEEKLDLFRGLRSDGLAVVGDEPPMLQERAAAIVPDLATAGWSNRAAPENRPGSPEQDGNGRFTFQWRDQEVRLGVPGRHSVQNALLALVVADALGVSPASSARGIGTVGPGSMRSEVRHLGKLTLLVDCYNANPQSLRAALELLGAMDASGRRVAVLGSMLELGKDADSLHDQALTEALQASLDLIVVTGMFSDAARRLGPVQAGPELLIVSDVDQARDVLGTALEGTEVVLLKASRGVALERLVPDLEAKFGTGGQA
jgi:UDP-N-acetylmuramoyl-tripeptide--D-alanyl-D-alanine ligase